MELLLVGTHYRELEAFLAENAPALRKWVDSHRWRVNKTMNEAWRTTDEYAGDVPWSTAVAAFSGTSHVPEDRAWRTLADYSGHLHGVAEHLMRAAGEDDALRETANKHLTAYRNGYRSRFLAWLGSLSGVVSSMIAGGSRFPAATMRKRSDAADNKWRELSEWAARAEGDALKAIKNEKMEGEGGVVADLERRIAKKRALQDAYKAINAILRKKITDDAKVEAIEALGFSGKNAREWLKPDFAGRIGVPSYALQNNLAEIKRLETRLEAEREKAAVTTALESGSASEFAFDGGTVVYNTDLDRVQIVYNVERVPRDVYDNLRRYGFVFSPRERAFQRRLNEQGVAAASLVTGLSLPWNG
jgi:hypothetical protein